jgi:Protein of unknown function (DUF1064)
MRNDGSRPPATLRRDRRLVAPEGISGGDRSDHGLAQHALDEPTIQRRANPGSAFVRHVGADKRPAATSSYVGRGTARRLATHAEILGGAARGDRDENQRNAAPLVLHVPRRNKYHAHKLIVDGYTFDSKKEARRYGDLKLYAHAGVITDLEVHPRFDLFAINLKRGEVVQLGHMTLDFQYFECQTQTWKYEDVKGGDATKTTAYRLRKRLLEANYGITVTEL